ncbi:MAG: C40 family peptidase [Clostridia bacterium]|nr:C40 family peptidase [Clostridia bacterium]
MKDKKSLAMIIIVGIVIVLFLCVNSRVFATTGTVVGDNLRVRKEENTTSEIIDLLDENDKVEILGENGDWYKVKANGKVGYVKKEFIKVQDGATINNETTNETAEEKTEATPEENNEAAQPTEEPKAEEQAAPEQPKEVKFSEEVELKTMPLANSIAINNTAADETYTVVCTAGSWAYVKSGNKEGWVLTEKSTEATAAAETETAEEQPEEVKLPDDKMYSESKTYYVKGSSVNVRNAATKDSDVVKVLNTNTEVEVVGEADSWYIVKVNGEKAYVAKSLLTTEKIEVTSRSSDSVEESNDDEEESYEEDSSSVPSNPIGSDVVEYALQFEGYSYVYGTNGPNTFDCSGFVQYVYKHFGIYLSRSSSTQANDGVYVSKDDLEPGDVLIFRDTSNSRIGHVGLYIGGGQFIHASNSRTGVIISSLDTSAYQKRYVCARRIL